MAGDLVIKRLILEPTIFTLGGGALLLISWAFYLFGKIRLTKILKQLVHEKNFKIILFGYNTKNQFYKTIFFSTALLCLFFCMLRPKWGKLPQTVVQEGRNIMIALDMSRSMLAKDFMPSRLEFIKLKLRILLDRLGPERVGLVLFSDKAFLHCPFTDDFNAFFAFLEQASPQVVSSGGTAISKALTTSIGAFKNAAAQSANKILFLITDGEDFSQDMEVAIKACKRENLVVFTVGIASEEGAPVPILDRYGQEIGVEKDSRGKPVLSKLNEPLLQSLSSQLGGEYVRASGSSADIDFIIKKIESFEKEKMGSRKANLYQERHNIFAAAAMLMILLEWFL